MPLAVAKAAMETGVAKKPITDFNQYKRLTLRLNPGNQLLYSFNTTVQKNPKTIIFAEEKRIM